MKSKPNFDERSQKMYRNAMYILMYVGVYMYILMGRPWSTMKSIEYHKLSAADLLQMGYYDRVNVSLSTDI